jgi:RNA polymerase sigma factor (sigma-70 family)
MQVDILWNKFKKGDHSAFELMYNGYIDQLIAYGNRFSKDRSLVEDAIHDLFVRLYERRERLNNPNSLKAYLFSSLRREIIAKQNRKDTPQDEFSDNLFKLDIDVEQAMIKTELKSEQVAQVQQVLNKLSDRQREVVYLSFYNNLSHDEIAEVLGINNQSVRNLLSQGLKRMRNESQLPLIAIAAVLQNFL